MAVLGQSFRFRMDSSSATFDDWNELQVLDTIVPQIAVDPASFIAVYPVDNNKSIKIDVERFEFLESGQDLIKTSVSLPVIPESVMQIAGTVD